MIIRDADGKLHIVSRKQCKNETVYNEKLYNIRYTFIKKFNSIFLFPPKVKIDHLKNLSDD
jgi:hypothetical protein